jgi:hypothetical protein
LWWERREKQGKESDSTNKRIQYTEASSDQSALFYHFKSQVKPNTVFYVGPRYHWIGGWVGLKLAWTQRLEEKPFTSAGDRTPVAGSSLKIIITL